MKLDSVLRHHGLLHQRREELLPALLVHLRQPALGKAAEPQGAVLAGALCLVLGELCARTGEMLLKALLLRV